MFFLFVDSPCQSSGMSTELQPKRNSSPCDTALSAAHHLVILIGRQNRLQSTVFDREEGQRNRESRVVPFVNSFIPV